MHLKTYTMTEDLEGAPAPFTLDLSLQGTRLVYHLRGAPTVLGDVAWTDPQRDARMAGQATMASRLSDPPIAAMIVVPSEYVVFGMTQNWDGANINQDMLVRWLLNGTGLYPDNVLAVFQSHADILFGAAVERKTLSEARQFASRYGFELRGYTTHPPRQIFPTNPVFNLPVPLILIDEPSQSQRFEPQVADNDPEALTHWMGELDGTIAAIGLEAGPLPQWLHRGLTEAGLDVVLMETRQVKGALKAMPIKTDRRDAEGIARLLHLGWFRPVHCKSLSAQEVRAVLNARKAVQQGFIALEMSLRGLLRDFGLKVGSIVSATPSPSCRG